MTAAEAAEYGLVDHVVQSRKDVKLEPAEPKPEA